MSSSKTAQSPHGLCLEGRAEQGRQISVKILDSGLDEEAVRTGECELQGAKCWEVGLAQGEAGDRALGAAASSPGWPRSGCRSGPGKDSPEYLMFVFFSYTCRFLILYCWSMRSLCYAMETGCCPYPWVPSASGRAALTP